MESKESPDQIFQERLRELHDKGKLETRRMGDLVKEELVIAPVTLNKDKLESLISVIDDVSRVSADNCWVNAMIELDIPHDVILKVWNRKDEKSVAGKNPPNPQSK